MTKYSLISSYIRKPIFINDFASDPPKLSLHEKYYQIFLSVHGLVFKEGTTAFSWSGYIPNPTIHAISVPVLMTSPRLHCKDKMPKI